MINKINPQLLTGSNLAYIGDAYFELQIRLYLLNQGMTRPHELQTTATQFVSAIAHAKMYDALKDELSEEECAIFRRGRNGASFNHRKGDHNEYLLSSGLEALFGYLYLHNQKQRLNEMIQKCILIIEGKKHEQ